jgi:pimeloyl-ACP methyl ester carboxylesterase
VQDINDSGDGQMLSAERLVSQTKSSGPKDLGLRFAIPMFFIQGAEDFTTPTSLARNYLDSIKAPRKEFVTINGGEHFAVFMHSDQFLRQLVARMRPLVVGH